MKININNNRVWGTTPTVFTCKYIVDINNNWGYEFKDYNIQFIPENSLLLVDEELNCVCGLISIVRKDAPKNAFLSSKEGECLSLEGVIQLEIEIIDIPQEWASREVLNIVFSFFQHHQRTYYPNKRIVLWFEYGEYYLCPLISDIKDYKLYNNFAPYFSELIANIINK